MRISDWSSDVCSSDLDDGYFDVMRQTLTRSRDRMADGLGSAGYVALPSQGTYFISIDLAASGIAMDDMAFCDWAVCEAGVDAIPVSAFYDDYPVTNFVWLSFVNNAPPIYSCRERLENSHTLTQQ